MRSQARNPRRRPVTTGLVLVLLGIALTVTTASAQGLFRCGGAYQDRPCDTEVQQRLSPATGRVAIESYHPRSSPACVTQGAAARTITTRRQAGLSLEDALAATSNPKLEPAQVSVQKDFVRRIYRMEGTPATVARAVEEACVASFPLGGDTTLPSTQRASAYTLRGQAESAALAAQLAASAVAAAR